MISKIHSSIKFRQLIQLSTMTLSLIEAKKTNVVFCLVHSSSQNDTAQLNGIVIDWAREEKFRLFLILTVSRKCGVWGEIETCSANNIMCLKSKYNYNFSRYAKLNSLVTRRKSKMQLLLCLNISKPKEKGSWDYCYHWQSWNDLKKVGLGF